MYDMVVRFVPMHAVPVSQLRKGVQAAKLPLVRTARYPIGQHVLHVIVRQPVRHLVTSHAMTAGKHKHNAMRKTRNWQTRNAEDAHKNDDDDDDCQ